MSRFKCHSDLYEMDLMLDINVSIYPVKVHRHLRMPSDAPFRLSILRISRCSMHAMYLVSGEGANC